MDGADQFSFHTAVGAALLIRWSDEDQVFIVSLPEFGPYANTHGATYDEAVRMGQEVLELLIESHQESGTPLPEPTKYDTPAPV